MRRGVVLVALAALVAAAGCGDDEPAGTPSQSLPPPPREALSTSVEPLPTRAALAARPGPGLAAQLDHGAVAVVDLRGRMAIRPAQLDFAHGGRLYDLEWRRWGDRGAVGTGTLEGVVCEPSCGRGQLLRAPARIRLSKPVACPRGRFFDRSRIEVDSDDPAAKSMSWLAAPC